MKQATGPRALVVDYTPQIAQLVRAVLHTIDPAVLRDIAAVSPPVARGVRLWRSRGRQHCASP